jgi:hypothetical protein
MGHNTAPNFRRFRAPLVPQIGECVIENEFYTFLLVFFQMFSEMTVDSDERVL